MGEAKWALVNKAGEVENVVLWDGEPIDDFPPEGCEVVALTDDQAVGPGFLWSGKAFSEPVQKAAPVDPAIVAIQKATTLDELKAAILKKLGGAVA